MSGGGEQDSVFMVKLHLGGKEVKERLCGRFGDLKEKRDFMLHKYQSWTSTACMGL